MSKLVMDALKQLQQWYSSQCDGDWEHQYGVSIETLDNPGWMVRIDLVGTPLENLPFAKWAEGLGVNEHPDCARWISCYVQEGKWQGASDETQLARLIQTFLEWSSRHA